MDTLRISAKDLGALKQEGFCPRCFWIERHMKLPYQGGFPGIFSSIDMYTKKIVKHHFERTGELPEWLSEIGKISNIVDAPKDFFTEKDGVKLTGKPDDMFRMSDKSIVIVDYKTARYTEKQDSLFPVYEVQLNGYAYIAETVGLGKVRSLYLVYFEPPSDGFEDLSRKHVNGYGFEMPFKSSMHQVGKNMKDIEALMKVAHDVYVKERPPQGLEGCEDCTRLKALAKEGF